MPHRRRTLTATALGAVLALVAAASPATPAAAKTERPAEGGGGARAQVASVTVQGYGVGHGRGLSQYGAQRRAADGQNHRQILDFYYPGTSWGSASGSLRILISDDSSSDLVVKARRGLTLAAAGRTQRLPQSVKERRKRQRVTTWRVVPTDGAGGSRVDYRTRSGWHRWRRTGGEVSLSAGGAPLSLVKPSGTSSYRGTLRLVDPPPASSDSPRDRDTVNVVPMEAYLRGVVPEEIAAEWQPEAVRAQAVAARTYAAYERAAAPAGRHYDLCSTDFCQVYEGADAEHPRSDAAIRATARRVLTAGGKPAFTQFSASNGGWTAPGDFPYLQGHEDTYDPRNLWTRTVSAADIEREWPGSAPLAGIEVVERDAVGDFGGRALRVLLTSGSGRTVEVSGDRFRLDLALPSTLFELAPR